MAPASIGCLVLHKRQCCCQRRDGVGTGGGRSPAWLCVMAGVSWPGRSYRLHQSRSTNLLSGLSQRHCYCRGHDAVSSGGGRPPAWLGVVADVAAGRDFTGVAAGGELTGIEADGADSGVLARDCGCRWSRG
nr:hypothetical protein Iba_chr10eCG10670 [Ipomoea batatas]